MIERPSVIVKMSERRCSNCTFGHQIVSFAAGGNVNEGGSETRWYTLESNPIGQTRNCYGWLEKELFQPEKFIYPGEDDTCVNPRKFKPKGTDRKRLSAPLTS